MSDTVRVQVHDLHRLLLEFRRQLERGSKTAHSYRGSWQHAVDYDNSFERLADLVDAHLVAAGCEPDPRTRCNHDNPVYTWPEDSGPVAWVSVTAGSIDGWTGPRLQHLAREADARGQWKALCGFTFHEDDIATDPRPGYRRCGVCKREQRLRGVSVDDIR